jgi:signal transduction histidine kinase
MTTAILHESQLVDDLTGLARAYAESQAFVSLLSHELHTRLKVTERALSSDAEGGVDTALENTRTMQELVETLLELARGQADESADAGAAVRDVLEDLREDVELLETDILTGALPLVRMPQGLLETVLRNLLTNALEAGASTVELFARPDGTVCVRDDGPGVPPERAASIFGVYSGKFGGAGLGLTLCREILRRRGGDIWLELPSTFAFRAA